MDFAAKYWDFIDHSAKVEILEGTTASGKTVAALHKFMLEVAESPRRLHVIAAKTTGVAEKNLINSDAGLIYQFGELVTYHGNGNAQNRLPHICFHYREDDDKIIYILGYDDKGKWANALGSQFGCVLIDEINTAHPDFVREISSRCTYLMGTLNPDDPELPVYREYINCCRPLPKYAKDVPPEIAQALAAVPPKPGWDYWFFSFRDNISLTPEEIEDKISRIPPGTKIYKNKVLGLRGRATGLVFDLRKESVITGAEAAKHEYITFGCGVDTAYSNKTDDTFAFMFFGITKERKLIILAEQVFNNRDRAVPISPSDIPELLDVFLTRCKATWGFGRNVFIDCADTATITECQKYKRQKGSVYLFLPSDKSTKIIDRIEYQLGWMARGDYLVADSCTNHIKELNRYCWKEDKDEPEDKNDHTINAGQYGWLPYVGKIGRINT